MFCIESEGDGQSHGIVPLAIAGLVTAQVYPLSLNTRGDFQKHLVHSRFFSWQDKNSIRHDNEIPRLRYAPFGMTGVCCVLIEACPQDGLKQLTAMGTHWVHLAGPAFRLRHLGAVFARAKEEPVYSAFALA